MAKRVGTAPEGRAKKAARKSRADASRPALRIAVVTAEMAHELEKAIPEFDAALPVETFNRKEQMPHYLLIGAFDEKDALLGFSGSYGEPDAITFYCWNSAVIPSARRQGIYTLLAKYREEWARRHGYRRLKLKTRNRYRDMLLWLVRNEWTFAAIEPKDNPLDNRIIACREIPATEPDGKVDTAGACSE